jgi:hypothetical protein
MTYTIEPQQYTDAEGNQKTAYLKVWSDGTFEEFLGSTAEEHLKNEGYGSLQLLTLLDLEIKLNMSQKSSGKLTTVRAWINSILQAYTQDPSPKLTWSPAPYGFAETVADAVTQLS